MVVDFQGIYIYVYFKTPLWDLCLLTSKISLVFLNQQTAEVRIWGVIIYLEDLRESSQVS